MTFFAKPRPRRGMIVYLEFDKTQNRVLVRKHKVVDHNSYCEKHPGRFGNIYYARTYPSLGRGEKIGEDLYASIADAEKAAHQSYFSYGFSFK